MALNKVRKSCVSGTFYPEDSTNLQVQLQSYLHGSSSCSSRPKALIVPHAGYIYSGDVAGSAYKTIKPYFSDIKKVFLLGPAHRVAVMGVALSTANYFETPLGQVPLDVVATKNISQLTFSSYNDEAHREEHSIEVHLPFLQVLLSDFSLLPLVVGLCRTDNLVELMQKYINDPEVLIVVSSDLSHFHSYSEAQKIDEDTALHIESLQSVLQGDQACGCVIVNALIDLARDNELKVVRLDVKNSGDTAGDKSRVVGYGSWAFV